MERPDRTLIKWARLKVTEYPDIMQPHCGMLRKAQHSGGTLMCTERHFRETLAQICNTSNHGKTSDKPKLRTSYQMPGHGSPKVSRPWKPGRLETVTDSRRPRCDSASGTLDSIPEQNKGRSERSGRPKESAAQLMAPCLCWLMPGLHNWTRCVDSADTRGAQCGGGDWTLDYFCI